MKWQFGIRTTNGKLVGVVLAYPVCMSIGRVTVMCVNPVMQWHKNCTAINKYLIGAAEKN